MNVLLVVNDNSPDSLAVGKYYQEMRGVPGRNICHISASTNYDMFYPDFTNSIRAPLEQHLLEYGLTNQIDYVVFSKDIPYRIKKVINPIPPVHYTNDNGITAVMFYDFQEYPTNPVCTLPSGSRQDYYEAERVFLHAGDPSSNRYYLSTVLTASDRDGLRMIVDRGTEADATSPTGVVYMLHTTDYARNIRWFQFEDTDFSGRFIDSPVSNDIRTSNGINGYTNLIGAVSGRSSMSGAMSADYLPGALADHLTSYGGCLFDWATVGQGQMSILEWLSAGCVGSYGTVVEPCAYTNKFPQVRLHLWYRRGFNVAESYWQSVQNPYMGVFVGDPLCAPYADPPTVAIAGVPSECATGVVILAATGTPARAALPVAALDLYLDGLWLTTLTNATPTPSAIVAAQVNGTNCTYTVSGGDDIFRIAAGLAQAVSASNLGVTASAHGDRIELTQDARGVSASNWICAASISNAAPNPGMIVNVPQTDFMQSPYAARQFVEIRRTALSGDVVRAVITRLDGIAITNNIVATNNGETARSLMLRLMAAVNADTNLDGSTGCHMDDFYFNTVYPSTSVAESYFIGNTSRWETYNLELDFDIISTALSNTSYEGKFVSNEDVMSARCALFLAAGTGSLNGAYALDTLSLDDGPHRLVCVAREGSAVQAQGVAVCDFTVCNTETSVDITEPGGNLPVEYGAAVTAVVVASSSGASVTGIDFYVEGKLHAHTNVSSCSFVFDTTDYGAGVVTIQARAAADDGATALSDPRYIRVFEDIDNDGLPDWWEYLYFDGSTNATASVDSDDDDVTNGEEYGADTVPTDSNSVFLVSIEPGSGSNVPARLTFESSSARAYAVLLNDTSLTDTNAWFLADTNSFWGSGSSFIWDDSSTNAPPATNSVRFYRLRATLP